MLRQVFLLCILSYFAINYSNGNEQMDKLAKKLLEIVDKLCSDRIAARIDDSNESDKSGSDEDSDSMSYEDLQENVVHHKVTERTMNKNTDRNININVMYKVS